MHLFFSISFKREIWLSRKLFALSSLLKKCLASHLDPFSPNFPYFAFFSLFYIYKLCFVCRGLCGYSQMFSNFCFRSRPQTPVGVVKSNSSKSVATANRASPSLPAANNVYASAPASVHSVFASEFFNNVSRGYDILFNIFQYLKVQVRNILIHLVYVW